ncbi:MAG: TM1812 family CRISPR-associated protein, partial [Anaerolineales bacterium]
MNSKRMVSFILVPLLVSLACGFMTDLAPDSKPSADATETTRASSDGFSAEAVAGGVSLKWEPISGAERYLIEIQIGDEFIPLVVLAADQLSYADEVPGDAQFTYRLTGLTDAGRGESKSVTVFVPEEQSAPQAVTITFDMAPAAIDPAGFDPNSFDPNTFDPNNFDPSMFAPQPLLTESRIGPAGGELSVTGTNGVTYILTVPPGALDFEVLIRLKPASSIPDLPLSGGSLGAVLIEPEGIAFDIPAELKMIPPEGSAPPAGPLQVGFAFEGSGQEFHLYPLAEEARQSNGGAHLASLSAAPPAVPPGSDLADILYGGGYGEGSGTVEDVKKIKTPSKSSNRTAQRAARAQMDELAPPQVAEPLENLPKLPSEAKEFGKIGESILDKSSKANDWSKLMEALDDFRMYTESGGDKFNTKLNENILDKILEKIKALLDKNMNDCLSREEMKAREMGRLLSAPQGGFWQTAADRFKKNYGEKLLKDLLEGLK